MLQKDADSLVSDTRALGDIVDDLLASATMTAAKPTRDRVDLAEVASSVRDSMAPYAESIGVTLTYVCETRSDTEEFVVIGSPAALRLALTALVDNALGHEHVGGTVLLRVSRDRRTVRADVADDGVGIDAETMATLFTRFSHGTEHTTREGRESYGIGLALVREIADAHGGDISVTSELGQGATFSLTLPAAER